MTRIIALMATTLAAGLMATCATDSISADMIFFSGSFDGGDIPTASEFVELPAFDTSLGELTSVNVFVNSDGVVIASVEDTNANGGSIDGFLEGEFTTAGGSMGSTIELIGQGGYDPGTPGDFFDVEIFTNGSASDSSSFPNDLIYFSGGAGDTIDVEVEFNDYFVIPSDFVDDVSDDFANNFGGDVFVTYTFTAVPEPGSLLILAGASMAVLSRRRRV